MLIVIWIVWVQWVDWYGKASSVANASQLFIRLEDMRIPINIITKSIVLVGKVDVKVVLWISLSNQYTFQAWLQLKNENSYNMLWMAFLEHTYKLKLPTRK